jgi:hypothetical protein
LSGTTGGVVISFLKGAERVSKSVHEIRGVDCLVGFFAFVFPFVFGWLEIGRWVGRGQGGLVGLQKGQGTRLRRAIEV